MADPNSSNMEGVKRFGDIAVELDLLSRAQVDELLAKQRHYEEMGIPVRIDEIAVEMGILARANCNIILRELKKQRKQVQGSSPGSDSSHGEGAGAFIAPFTLGPFEVEERLGGLMGTVFKALDTRSGRRVALKMLALNLTGDQPLAERFHREMLAIRKLSHPNIVTFLDAGEIQGRAYFCTEFIPGQALSEVLAQRGILNELKALGFVRDISYALFHAHANGLVHRDVKPENIIIDKAGKARLTDLGLVKLTTSDTRLTESGIAVGTPHYIAPEQARGARVIDGRADLYSLGATLFHLLCGRPPFDGNAAAVMRDHVFTDPPDPHAFNPQMSIQSRNLILKLMSKEPVKRVQSADELGETVVRIMNFLKASPPASTGGPPSRAEPRDGNNIHQQRTPG